MTVCVISLNGDDYYGDGHEKADDDEGEGVVSLPVGPLVLGPVPERVLFHGLAMNASATKTEMTIRTYPSRYRASRSASSNPWYGR